MLKQKENFATILKSSASDRKSDNCDEVAVYVLCEATFKPIDKVINFYLNRFGLYGKFRIGAFNQVACAGRCRFEIQFSIDAATSRYQ